MKSLKSRTKGSFKRVASLLVVGATVVLASACSADSVSAPQAATEYQTLKLPIAGILKTLFPMQSLTRDVPVTSVITRSFTIGKSGGKIELPETGLRIDVPSGAISDSLTITVTALPGTAIAYDFQPHGTVFLKPLSFKQDLTNTSWDKVGFKGTLQGGYFANTKQLDLLTGLALLDELFPIMLDKKRASFNITHFSGYMVSSGRQSSFSSDDF